MKQPYIAVGLSFFEDVMSLRKCLDSILENKDLEPYCKVLALDGRYRGYPADHDLSQDGSRELIQEEYIKKYPGHIELYDFPNEPERFKRQRYVDIAAGQEIPWLLILDSDEWVEIPDVERFIKELKRIEEDWYDTNIDSVLPTQRVANVVSVLLCNDHGGNGEQIEGKNMPRLWYRPQDVHYTTKHYWFARKEDIPDPSKPHNQNFRMDNIEMIMNSKYKSLSVNSAMIWHSHEHRDALRERRRLTYEFEELPKLDGDDKLEVFRNRKATTTK